MFLEFLKIPSHGEVDMAPPLADLSFLDRKIENLRNPSATSGTEAPTLAGLKLGLPGKGKGKKKKTFFDHLNEITAIIEAISTVADNVFNTADRVTARSKKLRDMYDAASTDVTSRAKRIGRQSEEDEDEETTTRKGRRRSNKRKSSRNGGGRSRSNSEESNQRRNSRPGRGR